MRIGVQGLYRGGDPNRDREGVRKKTKKGEKAMKDVSTDRLPLCTTGIQPQSGSSETVENNLRTDPQAARKLGCLFANSCL